MLNVAVENIGEMAVVECEGRLIQSESAHKLREAVTLQTDARIVILDLSAVSAVEASVLTCLYSCDDGRKNITFGSSCSIPPSPSRAN